MQIEARPMMGVDSAGMLCSAYDVGWISEPDNKLLIMPDDSDVGQPCPKDPPKVCWERVVCS